MLHLISEVQPFVISRVIMLMYERAITQGKARQSHAQTIIHNQQELEAIFRSFSYADWVPAQADITVMRAWLLKPLGTTANSLSRIILDGMNWGLTAVPTPGNGQGMCVLDRFNAVNHHSVSYAPTLPLELQRDVALCLIESIATHAATISRESYLSQVPIHHEYFNPSHALQMMQRNAKSAFQDWCLRLGLQLQLHFVPPCDMESGAMLPLRQVKCMHVALVGDHRRPRRIR